MLARRSHEPAAMRRLALLLLVALIASACSRPAQRAAANPQAKKLSGDVNSIDSTTPVPAPMTPPPMLTDEGPAPKPKGNVMSADAPPPPTAKDEALRASLPFAPAIGMDPVDGQKISIRADTPAAEYKNRVFYFSSEENKRTFTASPDQYLKGAFSKL